MSARRRLRHKSAKELVARIKLACPSATVEHNGLGHLKVTGPGGTAVIPANPKRPAVSKVRLARYAGIHI